jgi:hypothetical protein
MAHLTAQAKKRKREARLVAFQAPSFFFIGRQRDPPYAWAYDDDEMRASYMMWLVEEVIDGRELERVYLEENITLSKGLRMGKKQRGGMNRRQELDGGIIDMTLSDGNEDDADGTLLMRIESQPSPIPRDRPRPSIVKSRSSTSSLESSSLESTLTTPALISRDFPPTKMRLAVRTNDKAKRPERRAVFVSYVTYFEAG